MHMSAQERHLQLEALHFLPASLNTAIFSSSPAQLQESDTCCSRKAYTRDHIDYIDCSAQESVVLR